MTNKFRLSVLFAALCFFPLLSESRSDGLGDSAEILWDKWGVPHIYADSNEDLFYAFGYAQAHNHANRLLKLFGFTGCKAAEYYGENYIDYDRWARILDVPQKSDSCYEAQSDEMKAYIDAFAEGINDYALQNLDSISPVFQQVLPLSGRDVVGHTVYAVYAFLADLYIFEDAQDYLEDAPAKTTRESLNGSNAWAIAPSHTRDGNAILMANPHLYWPETSSMADFHTFFEAQLIAPGVNAYGAAILGMPFLQIAFNENLGWTHTVNDADYYDFYKIDLTLAGYQFDGEERPFDARQDEFLVRQDDGSYRTETVPVVKTVCGPILAQNGSKAIAFKTVDLSQLQIFEQYWNMCRASNFDEFEAAVAQMQIPYFNTLYADRDGRTYYFHGAMLPKRPQGDLDWSGAVPGNTSDSLWTQYHSYDEVPKVVDPQTGWLQNCNDAPWYCTYPQALQSGDYPSYMKGYRLLFRPQRSIQLMMEDDAISLEEAIEYKHSTRMLFADRVLDDLIEAANASDNDNVKEAAAILQAWDRKADNDSVGGLIFENWAFAMLDNIGIDMFAVPWNEDDPINTPRGLSSPFLSVYALDLVAGEIKEMAGTLAIPWGAVSRFNIDDVDLPGNGASGSMGVFRTMHFSTRDFAHQTSYHGDTYTAAVEFSNPVRAKTVLNYGNASTPGSPHRTDQLILASNKQMRDALLTREDVESNLEEKTVFAETKTPNWELH